jgi:hypothetical protein
LFYSSRQNHARLQVEKEGCDVVDCCLRDFYSSIILVSGIEYLIYSVHFKGRFEAAETSRDSGKAGHGIISFSRDGAA